MVLNVNRNGGVIMDLDFLFLVISFFSCFFGIVLTSFSFFILLKALIERNSKRTGGSFRELYEDNEPDNKEGD